MYLAASYIGSALFIGLVILQFFQIGRFELGTSILAVILGGYSLLLRYLHRKHPMGFAWFVLIMSALATLESLIKGGTGLFRAFFVFLAIINFVSAQLGKARLSSVPNPVVPHSPLDTPRSVAKTRKESLQPSMKSRKRKTQIGKRPTNR